MGEICDVGVVRAMTLLQVPLEAKELLENWGRWQRAGSGFPRRSSGLEGRWFRRERCPECYESKNPCDICRYQTVRSVAVDETKAMMVERALKGHMIGGNRAVGGFRKRDITILLSHFRGFRNRHGEWQFSNPKVLCRQLGINVAEYENTVSKLIQMTWNRVKQAKNA